MMIVAAGTAAAAVLMTSAVLADDISVRTSVGSGEVVFTETSETADISAEELSDLVKDGLQKLVALLYGQVVVAGKESFRLRNDLLLAALVGLKLRQVDHRLW